MNFAEAADGTEIAWTSEGEGQPMLLIAGQATSMDGWGPTAELLSRYYRVIRFDHRGIGQSGKGEAGRYTTRLFAEDAAAVLTAAGADLAHVYGHSMGGRVAQWLAVDHPRKVRTLILAATSGGRSRDAGTQPDKAALEALVSGDMSRLEELFFDADWVRAHPEATHTFFNSPASAWAKARHFRASREHDAWTELGSIKAPTLILHGTEDAMAPLPNALLLHGTEDAMAPLPNALLLREHIRASVLVRVPGAGHGLHLDHPETVGWIRQFIARKSS